MKELLQKRQATCLGSWPLKTMRKSVAPCLAHQQAAGVAKLPGKPAWYL